MRFTLSQSRMIIIGIALLIVIVTIVIFSFGTKPPTSAKVKLTVWGTFDSQSVWQDIAGKYTTSGGNADITYKEFLDPQTYESELLNALAAGTGPDIFMFQNTWLPKHIDKIVPLKETQKPLADFLSLFPEVVEQDFVSPPVRQVYVSPLYIDTLAMFYNKNTFDKKSIALVPATWTDFKNAIMALREIDPKTNDILKAGAAIGGSEDSIKRATDLLATVMLQSGTQMVDSGFNSATFAGGKHGLDSLNFYIQFANPSSQYYTWNDNLHQSIDNFAEGGVGMIFNYSHQIAHFRDKNQYLNFGTAPMPQIAGSEQPVAYANYWGLAVSNKSKNQDAAWAFVLYATTNEEAAQHYSGLTKKPPALRTLINKKLTDLDLGVFAKQALIARSWPEIDNNKVDRIFSNMIKSVIKGELPTDAALRKASDEVTQLMRLRK